MPVKASTKSYPTAGRFRDRAEIYQWADTPDGFGGVTRSWTPLKVVWGSLSPVSSGMVIAAEGQDIRTRYTFDMRDDTSLPQSEKLQLRDAGATYDVVGVLRDPKRGMMTLLLSDPVD